MILARNDHEIPPSTCPTCGRPPLAPPCGSFHPECSGTLDWLTLVQEDLRRLKERLEEATV
jgi:hypothetical protein